MIGKSEKVKQSQGQSFWVDSQLKRSMDEKKRWIRLARLALALAVLSAGSSIAFGTETAQTKRVAEVASTKGLIAFWDFSLMKDDHWTSYHDNGVVDHGYPIFLRRIGDSKAYTPKNWSYQDEASKLVFDSTGPFGHAVRFNKGYIYGMVPRAEFDRSPLDIHGRQPFTLIAWIKFIGQRHLVAGIWDEGGWNKYGGRRQIALFGGLFGSKGVIAHVSATGAASYPQSTASGSQYARSRAIDGRGFENSQWVAMAMTFDPGKDKVVAYLDGVATPTRITDPVAQSVFKYTSPVASNPFSFPWPLYSPRSFVLKFNGYTVEASGVYEHWLQVDIEKRAVAYHHSTPSNTKGERSYRVKLDMKRDGKTMLEKPIVFLATDKVNVEIPKSVTIKPGDEIVTSLHVQEKENWQQVGSDIHYLIREGAPFTFGRALGLGSEPIDHGTQLFIDGVAVFNRVLSVKELQDMSFTGSSAPSCRRGRDTRNCCRYRIANQADQVRRVPSAAHQAMV